MATRRTSARRPVPTRTALAASAALVLVLLSGCSAGSDSSSDDGGGGSGSDAAGSASRELVGAADQSGGGAAESGAGGAAAPAEQTGVATQQVISTGDVQLRAADVGQAVFDVRQVVDTHRGQVAEDDTETDRQGQALRSRMVLRIPTAEFDAAMDALGGLGGLVSSRRETTDVTTEVLDTDVRVEAQQRSIDRIQVLFDSATSIKDVVSIEAELSRRQADLASLQAQQRYLADQTAQSTITVSVERTSAGAPPSEDEAEAGFLAGLEGGWDALKGFLVAAATVAGALLPWLALLLVLALPGRVLLRRLRRRTDDGVGAAAPTL